MLGINLSEIYKHSELHRRNKNLIRDLSRPSIGSTDLHFDSTYSQPFFMECLICRWKQNLSYWRKIHYTGGRFFITIMIALLFGTAFWNFGMKRTKRQDLFNSMGSMYVAVLMLGIQNASGINPVVSMERIVFYKERAAGMYSALPYTLAQVAIELPYIFIQTLIYGILVYTMIGFEWTATKLFWYIFFMYFTFLYFTCFGMLAVGLAPDGSIAAIVSSGFYGLWNLFSGFLIPLHVAWTFYGLGASQFGDVIDEMETGEIVKEFLRSYYGFRHEYLRVVAVAAMACAIAFAFFFGLSVKYINFQRR